MAKPKPSSLIKPSIRVGDEKHPLEEIFDGESGEIPTMRAVGYMSLGHGNQWVSYVVTIKGGKVMGIEVDEPNLRQIAEESAKTSFVTMFVDQGFV